MDNPVCFIGGFKNWSHLATYSQHPPQVPAQTGVHWVGRSGPPFPARGNRGVSLKHDFIAPLFSSDCLHCSPLPRYRARLWLTFKIIKSIQSDLTPPSDFFAPARVYSLSKHLLGANHMQTWCWMLGMWKRKAAHPQRTYKRLSGRECVSGGEGVWGGGEGG